jgi:hypothetical protein
MLTLRLPYASPRSDFQSACSRMGYPTMLQCRKSIAVLRPCVNTPGLPYTPHSDMRPPLPLLWPFPLSRSGSPALFLAVVTQQSLSIASRPLCPMTPLKPTISYMSTIKTSLNPTLTFKCLLSLSLPQ